MDTLNNHFVVDEVEDYNYKDFEMTGLVVDIVAVVVDIVAVAVDMVVYIEVDIDFDINYMEGVVVDLEGNFEFQDIVEAVPFQKDFQ